MSIINEAVAFANNAHKDQVRKFGKTPYILHPLEVAAIASSMTLDEDVICAAILHDTVEDTDVKIEEIKEKFGQRVADLVMSETEDKSGNKVDTWKRRKEDSLKVLKEATDIGVKIVWLSDKITNLRCMYYGYLVDGDKIWDNFNQKDPKMHGWYYKRIAELTTELSDFPIYKEYVEDLNRLFGENI